MLAAATSSSRSAIQARPRRESRRRKLTNSTTRHERERRSSSTGRRSVAESNSPKSGRLIWSIGEIDWRPLESLLSPKIVISSPLANTRPMISPNASVTIAM